MSEADASPQTAHAHTCPCSTNFVETGKTAAAASELKALGFKVVIYPVSALLTVTKSIGDLMQGLKNQAPPRTS